MSAEISIVTGPIETLALDAVVNAANCRLLPGTGVDGALRAAAGPELTLLTRAMPAITEGEAVLTPAFNAPARHIVHTAAPIYEAPGPEVEKIAALGRCYRNCIALADAQNFASIAFPCLGTGNFGWPRDLACAIAIAATFAALDRARNLNLLVFCCFTEAEAALYRAALA